MALLPHIKAVTLQNSVSLATTRMVNKKTIFRCFWNNDYWISQTNQVSFWCTFNFWGAVFLFLISVSFWNGNFGSLLSLHRYPSFSNLCLKQASRSVGRPYIRPVSSTRACSYLPHLTWLLDWRKKIFHCKMMRRSLQWGSVVIPSFHTQIVTVTPIR